MSLAKGRVNPLNVVGQRKLSYIPEHFGVMNILDINSIDKIDQWIYYNLNSRYCVKVKQGLDAQRRIVDICEIGIEDSKELTMLGLACPYLHKNK
jgi:hypothetical protein